MLKINGKDESSYIGKTVSEYIKHKEPPFGYKKKAHKKLHPWWCTPSCDPSHTL